MRQSFFFILLCLVMILPSCKSNSKKAATALEQSQTTAINSDISRDENNGGFIGKWKLPITSQISTDIQLFYDSEAQVYYTKEKQSGTGKQDSLVVVITRNENGEYSIEYAGKTQDNYLIPNKQNVIWRCPGYDNVALVGQIDIEKLATTYNLYQTSSSPKPKWEDAIALSQKEKANIYEWSKHYVRISVVESSSLSFPSINDVKISSKLDAYRIEYKATGKDLSSNTIVYPVNLLFEKDDKGNLTFLSISME